MRDQAIDDKKNNGLLRFVNEWASWVFLVLAGTTIFYMRIWNLHFLIKIGIIFVFALVMVIDMGRKEEYVEIISDEDIEEQCKEQLKKK